MEFYYRKIAEIIVRDEPDPVLRAAAFRVLETGRGGRYRIRRRDRRRLKQWMLRWCDAKLSSASQGSSGTSAEWRYASQRGGSWYLNRALRLFGIGAS